MSDNGLVKSARKRLIYFFVLIAALAGLIGVGQATGAPASFTPALALDLQGGTQIILTPNLGDGKVASQGEIDQAVAIIRQRVDATGVSEAQITTQGTAANAAIVVSIPGKPDEKTLKLIKASALLEFRPVLAASVDSTSSVGGDNSASPSATPLPSSAPIATSSAAPTSPSDLNWVTASVQKKYDELSCRTTATSTVADFREPGQIDDPAKPLVTCDREGGIKYILGPVELSGTDISDAQAGTRSSSTGASLNEWAVSLSFTSSGADKFGAVTKRLFPLSQPYNQFAVTIDGYVITAPSTNAVITNGSAEITGNFTQDDASALADQLKYGSLPISFEVQSQENISATLGSAQLTNGLLAGAIGLLLVVIYSLFQYRGLAVVTIGSLVAAAALTYLVIAILSWRQGYRLSLSGVAGLIVAIGITADSFIVYFERVRDELREGRPLSAAVETGWRRAVRTILVSDGVSLLAAVTLYVLTVGNVRGFAFTLGLTTIIDLVVVAAFTHPLLQLLANTKFFSSGHKWSGFEVKSGSGYVGRGQFRVAASVSEAKTKKTSREATRRQTIAERKAAGAATTKKEQ
ncbi:MAG: protein translocase subunit SecD [Microbacteriaceae bacterium]